jgi:Fe-S cluster assembly protein SufD
MNTLELFKERFNQYRAGNGSSGLSTIRQNAFDAFNLMGIPTSRNEEWKYTRIGGVFNKELQIPISQASTSISSFDLESLRLPGHDRANELVFINGLFSFSLSSIRSSGLVVLSLEEAAGNEYKDIVLKHLGHSSNYLKDGIIALNTAFLHGGIFVQAKKGHVLEHPIYIYNVVDGRSANIFAQPRSLVHVDECANVQLVETYATVGAGESFTNEVMEVVLEQGAMLEYYKIQNDKDHANQACTTHIRQVGKSYVHTVTISLSGEMVRNNLNVILEAERCEAHLYGLYFHQGQSHIDNHTVVDNVKPNCLSNELYKGMLDDNATGVFNGKIFVRQQAQKTNAYQSNKNVLLSGNSSINSKPQLEIFADDVKCSHGCTVGRLNEEGLFYLRSRGISEKMARSLLLQAFTADILEHVKAELIRKHLERLIAERLEFD